MKNLSTIQKSILLILFLLVYNINIAQDKTIGRIEFRSAPNEIQQELSTENQLRVQNLLKSDDYLSVEIIDISQLSKVISTPSFEINMPGSLGKIKSEVQFFDYKTSTDFNYYGKIPGGETILNSENGRTYGQIRKNGRVLQMQVYVY